MNPWELINYLRGENVKALKRGEPAYTAAEIEQFWQENGPADQPLKPEWVKQIQAPFTRAEDLALSSLNQVALGGVDEILAGFAPRASARIAQAERNLTPSDRVLTGAIGSVPSMLLSGGAMPIARTAAGRVAQSMGMGGAVGAASGALNAEPGQRLDGAAMGGLVGAAGAGMISAPIEAVTAMRPSVRAARNTLGAVRRSYNPRNPNGVNEENAVQAMVMQAQEMESAGKTPMFADLSRPALQQADFAANNADEVLAPLTDALRSRQANQSRRLVTDLRQTLGFPVENVETRLANLRASRAAWADSDKGFKGLREQNTALDPSRLARSFGTPEVYQAWGLARRAEDMNAATAPAALRPILAGASPRSPVRSGRVGATFTDMHDFRKLLDDRVTANFDAGKGNLARAYETLRDKVDEFLEAEVPGYRDVMAEYAARSGRIRALEEGAKDWARRADDLAETVRNLTPDQLEEYRRGMAGAIAAELRNTQTNRTAANALINRSETADEKLRLVFGSRERFDAFMRRARMEADMSRSATAVGGSQTHRRGAAAAEIDPLEVAVIAGSVPSNAIAPVAAAKFTPRFVSGATAREMGPLVTAQGSDALDRLLRGMQRKARAPMGRFGNATPVLNGMALPPLVAGPRNDP